MSDVYLELELEEVAEPEVGEPVVIVTPTGTIYPTWLGVVGENGWNLTKAMRLMVDIEKEREAEGCPSLVGGGQG